MTAKLYLFPTTMGSFESAPHVLPALNYTLMHQVDIFIVENIRTARRFLKSTGHPKPIDEMTFLELGKHTPPEQISEYLLLLKNGKSMGLLSEAGTPCIADPGSAIVKMAHQMGVHVVPLVGPNSIILALMASGFNGQKFAFHGYLPMDKIQLFKKIREMETAAEKDDQTQIFIETPFRNTKLFEALLSNCQQNTMLCIATDLTLVSEKIQSKAIGAWKKTKTDFHKKPAVFLLYK